MNAPSLLQDLRARGVTLEAQGEFLKVDAPAGELTEADKAALIDAKYKLLELLSILQEGAPERESVARWAGPRTLLRLGSTGMSDIKLFRIADGSVTQLAGTSVAVEKSLQQLIETHLEKLLGVRFLQSEYSTGKTHGGRIDTLGLDENGYPVIVEYKRSLNENVINQGLYYLDWLMDHKGEFTLLVQAKLGKESADGIEWDNPRLLCVAGDFTKYDEYAVQQIDRNIELIRYRRYGDELLLFERANTLISAGGDTPPKEVNPPKPVYKTVTQILDEANSDLRDRYESLKAFLLALGDDVQINTLKYYLAFKRIKNFACVEFRTQQNNILVYVKVDPDSVPLEKNFARDVRRIGHYGTGDLEITIGNDEDLDKAKDLLVKSYEAS